MSNAKHTRKRKSGAKTVPLFGAAGLLSLAGSASAATAPVADLPTQKTAPNHEMILGEEELSDVSLATFYVFDKESAKTQLGDKVAWRGCGGCRCGGAAVADAAAAAAGAAAPAAAAVAVAAAGSGAVAASAKSTPPLKSHNKNPGHVLRDRGHFASRVPELGGRRLTLLQTSAEVNPTVAVGMRQEERSLRTIIVVMVNTPLRSGMIPKIGMEGSDLRHLLLLRNGTELPRGIRVVNACRFFLPRERQRDSQETLFCRDACVTVRLFVHGRSLAAGSVLRFPNTPCGATALRALRCLGAHRPQPLDQQCVAPRRVAGETTAEQCPARADCSVRLRQLLCEAD